MIALLQRVSEAHVVIDDVTVAAISTGLMVLLCAERGDGEKEADALLAKLLAYRVFSDAEGKMNRSLRDIDGGLLVVPQFTLAADTRSGTRPSLTLAAAPQEASLLCAYFIAQAKLLHKQVAHGLFGADMKVTLTNDGPVTFWLQVKAANNPVSTKSIDRRER